MRTGNFISSSHTPFLPLRSLSAVLSPVGVGGLLRRVAGWGFRFLLSRRHPRVRRPFFAGHARCAPSTPRAPRGVGHHRRQPVSARPMFFSISGTQASVLRSYAASLLHTVCAILSPIMLLPSPAPNPALNLAPFSRWTLRDKTAQRRLALR